MILTRCAATMLALDDAILARGIFPDPFRISMATARLAYFVVVDPDSGLINRPR
jgi:hypothetical protein